MVRQMLCSDENNQKGVGSKPALFTSKKMLQTQRAIAFCLRAARYVAVDIRLPFSKHSLVYQQTPINNSQHVTELKLMYLTVLYNIPYLDLSWHQAMRIMHDNMPWQFSKPLVAINVYDFAENWASLCKHKFSANHQKWFSVFFQSRPLEFPAIITLKPLAKIKPENQFVFRITNQSSFALS